MAHRDIKMAVGKTKPRHGGSEGDGGEGMGGGDRAVSVSDTKTDRALFEKKKGTSTPPEGRRGARIGAM